MGIKDKLENAGGSAKEKAKDKAENFVYDTLGIDSDADKSFKDNLKDGTKKKAGDFVQNELGLDIDDDKSFKDNLKDGTKKKAGNFVQDELGFDVDKDKTAKENLKDGVKDKTKNFIADELGIDPDHFREELLEKIIKPLIDDTAIGDVVQAIKEKAKNLTSTNRTDKTVAGDVEMHPTKEVVSGEESKAEGLKADALGTHDETGGLQGNLMADVTNADAAVEDALAADTGVSAARTKAGATDIETKGLNMIS